MNILVTGGAGYLGSTLVRLLLETGQRVRVIDSLIHGHQSPVSSWRHNGFEFVYGDIRDRALLQTSLDDIDSVVHLAAIVGDPACARDPGNAHNVNVDASLNLLEECGRRKIQRFVFASTCSNYGKMPGTEQYLDESSALTPLSVYAETKVSFEKALLDVETRGQANQTALRFATLYGVSPRMRFDLTVNEFTLDMLTKKHLTVFGEQFWRPYVHVRDAARAICESLRAPATGRTEVYNVGATNQNFRKRDLVERIRVHAPDAQVEYERRDEDLRDYRVSFEKISNELGFRATCTMEDGIAEIAQLVRSEMTKNDAHTSLKNGTMHTAAPAGCKLL